MPNLTILPGLFAIYLTLRNRSRKTLVAMHPPQNILAQDCAKRKYLDQCDQIGHFVATWATI